MVSREPRVLLLSEDAILRAVLLRRFEAEGWVAEEALHAEDAERRGMQLRPHIIVADIRALPDPEKSLIRWGKLPTLLKTRVIVIAENISGEQVKSLHDAGAVTVALLGHQTPQDIVRIARNEVP